MRIWVDADSCPKGIRRIILKGAIRTEIPVTFVADRMLQDVQNRGVVSFVQVEAGEDSADRFIIDHVTEGDLLITRDVPCASLAVEKGASVLDDRGRVSTKENIGERLALRDFYTSLREEGVFSEQHYPLGPKEIKQFASSFDTLLREFMKTREQGEPLSE